MIWLLDEAAAGDIFVLYYAGCSSRLMDVEVSRGVGVSHALLNFLLRRFSINTKKIQNALHNQFLDLDRRLHIRCVGRRIGAQ